MKHKIFQSVLGVTALLAVITIFSLMLLFFPFMENEILQELQVEAELIAAGIEENANAYFDKISVQDRRITLIENDGKVVYDSGINISSLDNHSNREEIQEAIAKGNGSSIRFSDTLTMRTINYAKKLSDGSILRISVEQNYVIAILALLIPPSCFIVAAVVFLSVVLSNKVTERILKPLYNLDPEHPDSNKIYEEILPLALKIQAQNRKLKENIYFELRSKQNRQSEFTANMTHELKTPLTSIRGFAELMMQGDLEPDTVKDFSASIYDEADRLIVLVNDIIKLAEMDEKEGNLSFEKTDIMQMTCDIRKKLSMGASKKNIKITISGDAALVYAQKRILYEMIYNLLDNAIKYNKENGTIDILILQKGENIEFEIKDSGVGIPKEDQKHIFERFYRVDKSRSKEVNGTGLGLAIVQQGAFLHNAKIFMESSESVGTKITLRFLKDNNLPNGEER